MHRHDTLVHILFATGLGFLASLNVGCGGENAPQGPELGSVQKYLDEHPEALEDEPIESEETEFAAAEEE